MLLTQDKSLCGKNQAVVVSKDDGQPRMHRAVNPKRKYDLRHYKLDGDIVKNEICCDFLLVNDSMKKAYFIELKGKNIDHAVDQLEAGEKKFGSELCDYMFFYRIVSTKVRTHKINSSKFRKFQEKCKKRLLVREQMLEEILD